MPSASLYPVPRTEPWVAGSSGNKILSSQRLKKTTGPEEKQDTGEGARTTRCASPSFQCLAHSCAQETSEEQMTETQGAFPTWSQALQRVAASLARVLPGCRQAPSPRTRGGWQNSTMAKRGPLLLSGSLVRRGMLFPRHVCVQPQERHLKNSGCSGGHRRKRMGFKVRQLPVSGPNSATSFLNDLGPDNGCDS